MNQVATFDSQVSTHNGLPGLPNVFQRRAIVAKNTAVANQSPEIVNAVRQINQLAVDYQSFQSEVLDRSDRALWEFLGHVYDYVLDINRSLQKRQIKSSLIEAIKMRDATPITSASETESIVVRYVFANVSRQVRYQYVVALEKALALDVPQGELPQFLERNNGVASLSEKEFAGNAQNAKLEKEKRKLQRAEAIDVMRRLLEAMSTDTSIARASSQHVADLTPSARELSLLKPADLGLPKYQAGDFVFFVGKVDETLGTYKLIQGFNATRDFEDELLQQIAAYLGFNNADVQATLSDFEASIAT